MRFSTFLALAVIALLLFVSHLSAVADVQWHKFGVSDNETVAIHIGRISVTVQTREVQGAAFREDHLVMTVRVPGQKPSEYWFSSAYGYGEVALHGDLLLLKYGVGRGTFVRVDHVKALQLKDSLEELVDVQSSYYVLTDPKKADPDLLEYRLNIQTGGGCTTLSFSLRKRQQGFPSEKLVRLKNDG
jgi:hypothetical protein